MLLRILILVLLLWLALELLFRGLRRVLRKVAAAAQAAQAEQASRFRGGSSATKAVEGELVRCAACGVRVPKNRALTSRDGRIVCSEGCQKAAEAGPS